MADERLDDEPPGSTTPIARWWLTFVVAVTVGLGLLSATFGAGSREVAELRLQVERQADRAGLVLLDELRVPRRGEVPVRLLMDGEPIHGVIRVEDSVATLLAATEDGLQPVS
jgi:hypothetical protein